MSLIFPFVAIAMLALVFALIGVLSVGRLSGVRIARIARIAAVVTMVFAALGSLAVAIASLTNDQVELSVPVRFPIVVAPELTIEGGPTATLVEGVMNQAAVLASGLSLTTRLLLAVASLVGGATLFGVAWITWRLAATVGGDDPFRFGEQGLKATALVVFVGGIASSVVSDLANWRASTEIFRVLSWSVTGHEHVPELTQLGWPLPSDFSVTIPMWPIGGAIVLVLLAAVFRAGASLRAETEGLV